MKHMQTARQAVLPTTSSRHLLMITFFLFAFFSLSSAHASGAKLPTVADDSTISDTSANAPSTDDSNGNTTQSPSTPPSSGGSTTIPEDHAHLDPGNVVPKALLAKALKYYDSNKSLVKNKDVIGVIDFSQHSSKERFYVIDMQSGRVETYQTAHGKNSDTDHDGYATQFSNTPGSNMSSQGIYLTAETYYGGHGYSLMLDGKSTTNSNARSRAIVIHPADYVVSGQKAGRSWGCPALDPRESEAVINQIKGGAVIYAQ